MPSSTRDKPRLMGAPNFRDLGGLVTEDGRTLRSGLLYRSESLSDLTDDDLQTLIQLEIALVCDLRSTWECARFPSRLPASAPEILAMPISVDLRAEKGELLEQLGRTPTEQIALDYMLGSYRAYPLAFAPGLRNLFTRIIDGPALPLLFHCAAGKDRTGFLAAILLRALGVNHERVMQDYLATALHWAPPRSIALLRTALRDIIQGEAPLATLQRLGAVTENYLNASFETIEQQHGGLQQYLEEHAGLNDSRLQLLRERLLSA